MHQYVKKSYLIGGQILHCNNLDMVYRATSVAEVAILLDKSKHKINIWFWRQSRILCNFWLFFTYLSILYWSTLDPAPNPCDSFCKMRWSKRFLDSSTRTLFSACLKKALNSVTNPFSVRVVSPCKHNLKNNNAPTFGLFAHFNINGQTKIICSLFE